MLIEYTFTIYNISQMLNPHANGGIIFCAQRVNLVLNMGDYYFE